jgi:hypothetical protein
MLLAEAKDGSLPPAPWTRVRWALVAALVKPDWRQSTRSGYREAGRPGRGGGGFREADATR